MVLDAVMAKYIASILTDQITGLDAQTQIQEPQHNQTNNACLHAGQASPLSKGNRPPSNGKLAGVVKESAAYEGTCSFAACCS